MRSNFHCRMNVTDEPDEEGYNWVQPPKVQILFPKIVLGSSCMIY